MDGGFDIERRFHAKFQDTHEWREWLTWSQGLDDKITANKAGAFDVSTLPEPVQITQRIAIPVKTEHHRKCASSWKIEREPCRERVCQYVSISVLCVSLSN